MQVEFLIEMNDIIVFFIAVTYAIIILSIADLSKRKFNVGPEFSRRIVHLFAGGAIWTVPFYPHPWMATFVALLFVIMLGLAGTSRFEKFFKAMARPEDLDNNSVKGPFWYAVSITVLTGIFTFTGYAHLYFIGAAAIHIMMWGDGMSAPVGIKYGESTTREIFGSKRSIPGSMALLVFGFIGAMFAFWWFGVFTFGSLVDNGAILWIPMITIALVGSVSATLIELVSPKGTDNTTLPLLTCCIMLLLGIALGVVVF
ncbi:MAG: diacylglycerol/polyprenol kinase family protein [Candidatus Thorarchaeota archaeon]